MKTYIGTKIVHATPMDRAAYHEYRGWGLPADENGADHGFENGADPGFLVEYVDGGKSNDPRHAGYISWSPLDVFARAYRPVEDMTFGAAIEALKAGKKVARAGWNGKGMWLSLSCAEVRLVEASGFWSPHNAAHAREQGGAAKVLPSITMKTATGEILMGWLASQTDMLAEDWRIVE